MALVSQTSYPIMIYDPAFASWFVNDPKINVGQYIQNEIWTFPLVLQLLFALYS